MNKEYLEALEHVYYGSQGYGETDKYYKYLKEYLESIDSAEPSAALKTLKVLDETISPLLEPVLAEYEDELSDKITANYFALKQALLKAEKDEKIILGIEDYLNRRIKVEPLEDVRKAFIEIRNQLQVIKEVLE